MTNDKFATGRSRCLPKVVGKTIAVCRSGSACRISTAFGYPSRCVTLSDVISDKERLLMVDLMVGTAVGATLKARKPKPASNGTATGSDAISPQIEIGNAR